MDLATCEDYLAHITHEYVAPLATHTATTYTVLPRLPQPSAEVAMALYERAEYDAHMDERASRQYSESAWADLSECFANTFGDRPGRFMFLRELDNGLVFYVCVFWNADVGKTHPMCLLFVPSAVHTRRGGYIGGNVAVHCDCVGIALRRDLFHMEIMPLSQSPSSPFLRGGWNLFSPQLASCVIPLIPVLRDDVGPVLK